MGYQPKSYRKFLATSVGAVMAASSILPVAASAASNGSTFTDVPSANAGQVAWAVGQNIIKGYPDGTFKPWASIDRAHAAVMIANAKGLTPVAVTSAPFKDVAANDTYAGYIKAVADAKIFNGDANGNFNPDQILTREQMATVLVNAFGLKDNGANVTVADMANVGASHKANVQILADLGITNLQDGKFNPGGDNTRLNLVSFLYQVDQYLNSAPAVASVSAVNGKQLLVTFNKAVDPSTASDEGNYTLSDSSNSVDSAVVQANGKSVVLTLTNAYDNASAHYVALTVDGVATKADTNVLFPLFSDSVKIYDTTGPTVASVTSVTKDATASSATIKFSEPVASGDIIIDGGATKYTVTADSDTTVINSGLSLDTSKSHTIEVVNLTDTAGNVTSDATSSFSVTKDSVVPTVSVSAYNDNQVLLTFSKEMPVNSSYELAEADGTTAVPTTNFKLKDEALGNIGTVASITAAPGDTTGTKFVLDFTADSATFYANSDTRNLQLVIDGANITDTLGNKLADAVKSVTFSKDATAPSLTNVSVVKDNTGAPTTVVFHYNEPVKATGGQVTIVDKNGVLKSPATGTLGSDGKSIEVDVTGLSGTISMSYASGFVTDTALNTNDSAAYSSTVNLGTPNTPTVKFDVDTVTPGTNTISVDFGTAVRGGAGADSATNLSNYYLNGKSLPAGTSITLESTQNVATITLPAGSIAEDTDTAVFKINAGIAGLDGSVSNAYIGTLSLNDNTAPVLQSARLVSNTGSVATFELTFSEAMNTLSSDVKDELTVKDNGTAVTPTTATAANVAGFTNKVLVTFTGAVVSSDTLTITTKTPGTADLKDASDAHNAEAVGTTVTVSK